jgi:hypothetical protein
VGSGHGNKRHGVAIGLTTGCLAVAAGRGVLRRRRMAVAGGGAHGGSGCCAVEAKCGQTSARVSYPGC